MLAEGIVPRRAAGLDWEIGLNAPVSFMDRILEPREQCPCTLSAFIRLRALHMSREALLESSRPPLRGVVFSAPRRAAACMSRLVHHWLWMADLRNE